MCFTKTIYYNLTNFYTNLKIEYSILMDRRRERLEILEAYDAPIEMISLEKHLCNESFKSFCYNKFKNFIK